MAMSRAEALASVALRYPNTTPVLYGHVLERAVRPGRAARPDVPSPATEPPHQLTLFGQPTTDNWKPETGDAHAIID